MGREEDRPSRGKGLPSPSPSPGTHALCLLTEHFLAHIVDLISALTEGTRHPGASVPMLRLFHHLDYTSVPCLDFPSGVPPPPGRPPWLPPAPLGTDLCPQTPLALYNCASPGVFIQPLTLPAHVTPAPPSSGRSFKPGSLSESVLDPGMLTDGSSHRSVPQNEQASDSGDSGV